MKKFRWITFEKINAHTSIVRAVS